MPGERIVNDDAMNDIRTDWDKLMSEAQYKGSRTEAEWRAAYPQMENESDEDYKNRLEEMVIADYVEADDAAKEAKADSAASKYEEMVNKRVENGDLKPEEAENLLNKVQERQEAADRAEAEQAAAEAAAAAEVAEAEAATAAEFDANMRENYNINQEKLDELQSRQTELRTKFMQHEISKEEYDTEKAKIENEIEQAVQDAEHSNMTYADVQSHTAFESDQQEEFDQMVEKYRSGDPEAKEFLEKHPEFAEEIEQAAKELDKKEQPKELDFSLADIAAEGRPEPKELDFSMAEMVTPDFDKTEEFEAAKDAEAAKAEARARTEAIAYAVDKELEAMDAERSAAAAIAADQEFKAEVEANQAEGDHLTALEKSARPTLINKFFKRGGKNAVRRAKVSIRRVQRIAAAMYLATVMMGVLFGCASNMHFDLVPQDTATESVSDNSLQGDIAGGEIGTDAGYNMDDGLRVKSDAEMAAEVDKEHLTFEWSIYGENTEIESQGDHYDGESLYFDYDAKHGKNSIYTPLYDMDKAAAGEMTDAEITKESLENLTSAVYDTAAQAGLESALGGDFNSTGDINDFYQLANSDDEFRKNVGDDLLDKWNEEFGECDFKSKKVEVGTHYGSNYAVEAAEEEDGSRLKFFIDDDVTAREDFYVLQAFDGDQNKMDSNEIGGFKYNFMKSHDMIAEDATDEEAIAAMEKITIMGVSERCTQIIFYSTPDDKNGGEKVAGEKTAGEKTAGEKTGGEKTAGEKTGGEKTAGEKTAGEKTAGEKTAGEKTAGEKTAGEKTAGEKTAGEKGAGEKKAGEKDAGEITSKHGTTVDAAEDNMVLPTTPENNNYTEATPDNSAANNNAGDSVPDAGPTDPNAQVAANAQVINQEPTPDLSNPNTAGTDKPTMSQDELAQWFAQQQNNGGQQ